MDWALSLTRCTQPLSVYPSVPTSMDSVLLTNTLEVSCTNLCTGGISLGGLQESGETCSPMPPAAPACCFCSFRSTVPAAGPCPISPIGRGSCCHSSACQQWVLHELKPALQHPLRGPGLWKGASQAEGPHWCTTVPGRDYRRAPGCVWPHLTQFWWGPIKVSWLGRDTGGWLVRGDHERASGRVWPISLSPHQADPSSKLTYQMDHLPSAGQCSS